MSHIEISEVVRTLEDGILTVRMNRPEKKNALSHAMYRALATALREADQDEAVRVVLLCGGPGAFTTGNDLSDFLKNPLLGEESPVLSFLYALADLQKPLFAAIEGLAVGVGVTLLLHCDYVCAGASSTLQMPFINLGLVPEAASTLLLPRMLGHLRASELLLFGEPFSAKAAQEAGLVTTVCADDQVMATILAKARQLAAQPAAAVRQTKALLKASTAGEVRETLRREAEIFVQRLASPEANEALTAFAQRRAPDFSRFH
jgi:enoyl-CoA hydratase/carnithine racemase